MDLSRFDTREKSSAGVDVPLVIDGQIIYGDDDKPVTFRVRGIVDDDVHKCLMDKRENKTPAEVREGDLRLARVAVVGWSDNFTVNGEKVPFSRSAIDTVLGIPALRGAVIAAVFDEKNFTNGS